MKEVVAAALERPAAARAAFLDEACGEDPGLRREVDSLIAARAEAGDFLSQPAALTDHGTVPKDTLGRPGTAATAPRLTTGTRLGPYEVISFVGAGGMGEVYRARDMRLERVVAVKVLPADFAADPERARRFEREARTVSRLSHPHICALHDVGQHDGSTFLVMEYLEGESLAARLQKGPLPLDEAVRHGIEIAEALEEAHRQGIVHRDLKPANVMLTRNGAKLLDFGIAKIRARLASEEQPTATAAVGTTAAEATGAGVIAGHLHVRRLVSRREVDVLRCGRPRHLPIGR